MSSMRPVLVALTVLAAAVLAACGGSQAGNGTDRAFVDDMIPHHASAVDMAETALERGERPEIKALAKEIVASQGKEIEQLKEAQATLAGDDVEASELGVPMHMMGMDMDTGRLRTARPFDRAFIDMMIPHHQGAVRMARAELAKGADGEMKDLAEEIVTAQAGEIEQMNAWRRLVRRSVAGGRRPRRVVGSASCPRPSAGGTGARGRDPCRARAGTGSRGRRRGTRWRSRGPSWSTSSRRRPRRSSPRGRRA